MTDLEFEILDQIYFVESFEKIQSSLSCEEKKLFQTLREMIEKGWVKCLIDPHHHHHQSEVNADIKQFEEKYKVYQYLATKEGLLAHNSR